MNILFLVEGDAESPKAWSGIAQRVVAELRARGHEVVTGNVDLDGFDRWIAAARVFSSHRERWGVKYRLLAEPARRRSIRAGRHIRSYRDKTDLIFQIGASFEPLNRGSIPYVLYCDSSIRAAERGLGSGFSPAQWLRPEELREVVERETRVYRGASLVFSTSERLTKSFVEDFELPESQVKTVYGGPNFDLSSDAGLGPSRRGGPPTILFVGGQFDRKGGGTLVEAFRRVQSELPSARLVIIGPEEEPAAGEGIEWLGWLDKQVESDYERLVAAYLSAHVFCLPTRYEPTGMVFFEAMAFGLPCVGTSNSGGAVPEVIADGETGFTVEAGDERSLADRLLLLLRDPQLAERMGAEGRMRAASRYNWSAVVDKMLAAICELKTSEAICTGED